MNAFIFWYAGEKEKNNTTTWMSITFQCRKSLSQKTLKYMYCPFHPILPAANPVYWPKGSGYLSLILHTEQEGITLLSPAPSLPWVHRIYCLYAWCRLALFQSASSSNTKMSRRYNLLSARTASSRISTEKS